MKRVFLIAAAAVMMFASCQKPPTSITDQSSDYTGTMIVGYEGEEFVQKDISVMAEIDEDGGTMDLMLKKVKFVPAMPIRIDVTIMSVPVEEASDGSLSFSADGVVPWAMGGPYDTYRVDGLSGVIQEGNLSFILDFFNTKKNESYPVKYEGNLM